jgi:hypothetical protein
MKDFIRFAALNTDRAATESVREVGRGAGQMKKRWHVLQYPVLNIMMFRNVKNWYHHRRRNHENKKQFGCAYDVKKSKTAAHLLRLQPALYSICERVSTAGQNGS